jgi:hypothetical protein
MIAKIGLGVAVFLFSFLSPRILAAQVYPADLILIHGKIITVDAKDSVAQAIAIH